MGARKYLIHAAAGAAATIGGTSLVFLTNKGMEALWSFSHPFGGHHLSLIKSFIINQNALPCLLNLLTHNHKKSIKKEACWTISNITAGNKEQIQAVITADIIGPLVHLLQTAEFDIKKEAAWAISNATSGGTHDQIKFLVSQGCIKPLCDLLVCPDPRIVTVCLEGLENILKVGEAEKNAGTTGGVNLYAA
ncbi:importin subunit alpha-1b-like [Dioscorea cayenensis subsp. rotundata]|uniref:Importin subunit alpha-1b-like n=1 Tax=Dioscorea cayennensis subsp. rotundata TaxID=55577 RepID=A0AB40BKH2_DIOCR|nr:importin subunit alpha-1b-like [Dioscorea cayenensis subsp. rotundata]